MKNLMVIFLVMVFSGPALGWTPIDDPNYNLSFEYDVSFEQMWCHADGNLVEVLAWNDNEVDTARTEIDCPNSLGIEGCLCKDDWASDGFIKLTMGQWVNPTDQNVIAWQTLDPAYDANVIIKADHEYRVTFDSHKWMTPPLTFYFYYGHIGDNNSIDVDVNTIAEFDVMLETGLDEYQTVTYSFRAEAEQPYLGEPLGLRFLEIGQGFYWIDDIRIEYRNLALAREPSPEYDAKYVSQNVGLNWAAGTYVANEDGHEVYFGTSWSDVNDADKTDTTNIFRGGQDTNSYAIPDIPLELGQTYYWRVDEVNEAYVPGPIPAPPDGRWKGPIWEFRGEGPAANPSPEDEAEDESIYTMLKWEPGTGSDEHDVYFGTDFDEVSEANNSLPPGVSVYKGNYAYEVNSYDPCVLELGQTYYWRIDEYNDTEGRLIDGYIWSFTTAMYHVIDDMEAYESGVNEIRDSWKDYWDPENDTTAEVFVETDANYVHDGDISMRYWYRNDSTPYYALAELPFDDPQDWTAAGFKALTLYLRGDFLNESGAVQPIYIQVSDDTNTGTVQYEDSNDLLRGWAGWQEWNIELQDFVDDNSVNLSAITKLGIKIGDGIEAHGGDGDVYFDDIRLYPSRCVVEEAAGNFTDHDDDDDDGCGVDMVDLEVLASDWLLSGIGNVTASPPSNTDLHGHWTMNDNTSSSEVLDSSVEGNHGVFYDDATGGGEPKEGETSDHSVAGVNDLALEFDGENDYVEIPALDVSSNTITIAVWIKRTAQGRPYDGIVMSSNAYNPDGEAPDPNYTAGLQFRADTETYKATYELSFMWTGYSWEWCTGLFVPPEEWAFTALTVAPDVATIYLHDGITMQAVRNYDTYEPLSWDAAFHIANQMQFGPESPDFDRFFPGVVDDVYIYNRTLAPAEILYLAQVGDAEFPLESWRANANPDDDDVVDLKDFAIMADNWLEEFLFPPE